MKTLQITSLCLLLGVSAMAQQVRWIRQAGAQNNNYAHIVATDKQGGVLQSGFLSNGSGSTQAPRSAFEFSTLYGTGLYLSRHNGNGGFSWGKFYNSTGEVIARDMIVDQQGNIIISGSFTGALQLGNSLLKTKGTTYNDYDGFVGKFNAQGDILWAKQMGGRQQDDAMKVAYRSKQ